MTIRVAIRHRTTYRYDRLVTLSPHVFRLRPAAHSRTPVRAYSLKITPANHFINWQQDPFGNFMARVVFPEAMREMSLDVEVIADMTVINPFDFFVEEYAEEFPFTYETLLARELAPYRETETPGPLLTQWLNKVDRHKGRSVDFLVHLNQRLQREIGYTIRLEPGVQSCEETLERRTGSCRDSALLLVTILRHLGLAARFVSGYLVQLTPDEKPLEGPAGTDRDFTDLHAWAEVYLPGAGWIGLDPTSGLFAGEGHIPLACTPHHTSAAPVTGCVDECETEFLFENTVIRLHEDPRVTKPYTDHDWSAILALGERVDERLLADDVRLTMGGEPTFTAMEKTDDDEWNFDADGPRKRLLAEDLLRRLHAAFAPGGVLQHGQGKWYPGEPLPRWRYGCFWRKDGQPLWKNPALLARLHQPAAHGPTAARRYLQELARRLGVDESLILPGFEDRYYHLWKEGNLPQSADLDQIMARLDQKLGQPVGWALPLGHDGRNWQSCIWSLRRKGLFLIPGDSPMGLRLPLESLPALDEEEAIPLTRSLFEVVPALAEYGPLRQQVAEQKTARAPGPLLHTACCAQVRDGLLHLFLPPVGLLEHYVELVATVESVAESLELPVVLEGYEPPQDLRLQRFMVTPDPAVIEVNIHPAASWSELVTTSQRLYEEARQSRLATEKFMLDGRHTGTGGGNHVVIGGATPSDSPLLRRPDLLRSLVTCWQHHPGLSYLFSGLFIGPTSQAPRVDEARHENLHELEIAFANMPDGEVTAPWLVDRMLRHLLVDLTGNTHRSEFCIDKLYNPDSATGRQGLLELRAFEMPPHSRMSLVQMLLIRTLIAHFWRQPYHHRLVRWGTALHDRFLLPHHVRDDVKQVTAMLRRAGLPFRSEWLDPFWEFRFPHIGTVVLDDVHLELRMALEPWHVLGEEVSRGGTSRFVDASLERLQIHLTGRTEGRHVVTCNGRRVPLQPTGTPGEAVGGVRFRAWQPPSCLHPTIGVQTPLVFDLVDTWNGHSLGGCTYHAGHPGGRNYQVFPVNSFEAEARRGVRYQEFGHRAGPLQPPPETAGPGRFVATGHLPRPMSPPPEEPSVDFPHTLDLRRPPELP
ncbi:MAG: transglutaminase family protein [Magnetococcales bacterium]|nr:transglutaminase family protein [Magnetococcales bacterium]